MFYVLCANLFLDGKRFSCTRDYVIVEKSAFHSSGEKIKVKIGIIGFAINYSSSIAAELESSGQCDATILLIHGKAETAAERLGSGSVIDLVVGGPAADRGGKGKQPLYFLFNGPEEGKSVCELYDFQFEI